MNQEYKIGDIAKLLDMPAQTIRFYEEKGLIKPKRDEVDGYRYFDAWDVNYLMDIMYYKSMNFSLQTSYDLLINANIEESYEKFEEHELYLVNQIEKLKRILKFTTIQKQRIKKINLQLGKFEMVTRKDYIFYRQRLKNTFQSLKGSKICDLQVELKEWMNLVPDAVPAFLIPLETVSECIDDLDYWWGWSMNAEDAVNKGVELKKPNEYLPQVDCLHTVFYAEGKNTFRKSIYDRVISKVKKNGYRINGDIYGQLIIKPHDKEGLKRYFEIWVPVSQ